MKNKRIASIVLAMILTLSMFTSVLAAELDIVEADGSARYDFAKWTFDDDLFVNITYSQDKYLIELDEELYKFEEVTEEMSKGKTIEEAVEKLEPVEEPSEDLEVIEVSAITKTIDNEGGFLAFTVKLNNGKEVEIKTEKDLEDLKKNYKLDKVEFKADKGVFVSENNEKSASSLIGIVAKNDEIEKFNVEIHITPEEGDKIESDRVEVEVQDYDKVVTSIDKVEVRKANEEDVVLDNLVLDLGESYTIKVIGNKKSDKEDAKAEELGADLFEIESSTPAVVSVAKGNKLTANAKGTATITIKAKEGDVEPVKLKVEVKDEAKISAEKSTVELEKDSIATGDTAKIILNLKDENGNVVSGLLNETDFKLEDAKIVKLKSVDEDGEEKGKYTIEVKGISKGKETLVLNVKNSVKIEVGEIEVKEAKDEIANYKLVAIQDKKEVEPVFDLKDKENTELELNLKGYDDQGLLAATQPKLDGENYKLVSKNEDVVNINNENKNKIQLQKDTAKAGDKVIIEAYKITGALKDKVAEIEISVVDTTPELKEVNFKEVAKVTALGKELDLAELVDIKAEDKDGKTVEVELEKAEDGNQFDIVEKVEEDKEGLSLGTIAVELNDLAKISDEKETVLTNIRGKGEIYISAVDKDDYFKGDLTIEVDTTAEEAKALKAIKEEAEDYVDLDLSEDTITIKSEKKGTKLTTFVTEENLNLAIAAGITEVKCGETTIDINNDTKVENVKEILGEKTLGNLAEKKSVTVTMDGEKLTLSVEKNAAEEE